MLHQDIRRGSSQNVCPRETHGFVLSMKKNEPFCYSDFTRLSNMLHVCDLTCFWTVLEKPNLPEETQAQEQHSKHSELNTGPTCSEVAGLLSEHPCHPGCSANTPMKRVKTPWIAVCAYLLEYTNQCVIVFGYIGIIASSNIWLKALIIYTVDPQQEQLKGFT